MRHPHTYRLPEETDATIKRIAKEDDVSEADVIVKWAEESAFARQQERNETPRKPKEPMKPLLDAVVSMPSKIEAPLAKARENAPNFLKKK